MKVVHVVSAHNHGIYGKERVLLELLQQQDTGICPPSIIMIDGSNDFFGEVMKITEDVYRASSYRDVNNVLDELLPEVVHTHDYKSGIFVGMRKLWTRNHPPIVRTIHGYTSTGKRIFSKIRLYEFADKVMMRMNDVVVGVSDSMQHMTDATIDNGISPWWENPYIDLNPDIKKFCEDGFIIGCLARISAEKNLINLVVAMDNLPNDYKLVLFGSGPQEKELARDINERGLNDRVYLAGYDSHASQYLRFFDAYIQPSLTEGTPISVLEAMSAGVPLILSRVGGMIPIIQDYAASDCGTEPTSIASTIEKVFTSPSWRDRTVAQGKRLFNEQFSVAVMANRYDEIYTGNILMENDMTEIR